MGLPENIRRAEMRRIRTDIYSFMKLNGVKAIYGVQNPRGVTHGNIKCRLSKGRIKTQTGSAAIAKDDLEQVTELVYSSSDCEFIALDADRKAEDETRIEDSDGDVEGSAETSDGDSEDSRGFPRQVGTQSEVTSDGATSCRFYLDAHVKSNGKFTYPDPRCNFNHTQRVPLLRHLSKGHGVSINSRLLEQAKWTSRKKDSLHVSLEKHDWSALRWGEAQDDAQQEGKSAWVKR